MSTMMDEEIKRWTARRKTALVLEIIQGKTTVAQAAREFDLTPSEIEEWIDQGKRAWRTRCGPSPRMFASSTNASSRSCRKCMARRCWSCAREKNCSPCWARTRRDRSDPPGTQSRPLRGIDHAVVPLVRGTAADAVLPFAQIRAEDQAGVGRADPGNDRAGILVRLSHRGAPAGNEQEHGAAHLPAQRLAVRKRPVGHRPRIQALSSVAQAPDQRWSTDLCRIWVGSA